MACPQCRREYDLLKRLVVGTSAALAVDDPPEEVWDGFLESVYNRLERKSGWTILITGCLLLAVYGAILYVFLDWANPLTKFLLALPVGGWVCCSRRCFASVCPWPRRTVTARR